MVIVRLGGRREVAFFFFFFAYKAGSAAWMEDLSQQRK